MKLGSILVMGTLGVASCSVGGVTVSLGGGQLQSSAGFSGNGAAVAGAAGLSALGGNTGDGGLNVELPPMEATCKNGKKTTISGTVWDPAGKVPLYNAVVYVPKVSGQLDPFKPTVACEYCTDSVPARAVTLSGPDGKFVLEEPLYGGVDLVVQVGKWRRLQTVSVLPCQDNPITDPNLTRLPRNQKEGDIPKIAVSTGHADALECLLRKIGIDDAEFTTDSGSGRVNMFVGCVEDNPETSDGSYHTGASHFSATKPGGGGSFPSTNQLFDAGKLDQYDAVVFSCEGHRCTLIQTTTHVAQLVDFANRGGRVFLDHEHYNWISHASTSIANAAVFGHESANPSPLATKINVGFPKGAAFAQWLQSDGVRASSQLGVLDIYTAQSSVQAPLTNAAQQWVYQDQAPGIGEFYFTIGTPVAANVNDTPPPACGRVVFTDLHLSKFGGGTATDFSDQNTPFPDGCTTSPLSPQEKALEFMFFDLTSCVQQEDVTPTPPILK